MLMKDNKTVMHVAGDLWYWHFSRTKAAYSPLQSSK